MEIDTSANILRLIKVHRMRWGDLVTGMSDTKHVHNILVGKPEGTRPFGRPRQPWQDDVKMDLKEGHSVGWHGFELSSSLLQNLWQPRCKIGQRESQWEVGSPGNFILLFLNGGSPGWVTTESALEFTVLYTLCCCLALSNKRKGSPLVREKIHILFLRYDSMLELSK
uniref:Uncharacterized protein n=1 Tax=Timema cristinae TaxID=61476 RepID=A0A7R9CHW0_TIMCR|nr:unnamed protein product [Timema cristinae]